MGHNQSKTDQHKTQHDKNKTEQAKQNQQRRPNCFGHPFLSQNGIFVVNMHYLLIFLISLQMWKIFPFNTPYLRKLY